MGSINVLIAEGINALNLTDEEFITMINDSVAVVNETSRAVTKQARQGTFLNEEIILIIAGIFEQHECEEFVFFVRSLYKV